jgi:pectin methylesterase-like acyl-CoA thioesterase
MGLRSILSTRSGASRRTVAIVIGLVGLSACSGTVSAPPNVVCTMIYVYGLNIQVQNAATGAPVTDSATVKVTDGSYVETYNVLRSDGTIGAAGERAGTYSVSIRKNGFAPYDTAGVRVTRDVCHVTPVHVTAKLQQVAGG